MKSAGLESEILTQQARTFERLLVEIKNCTESLAKVLHKSESKKSLAAKAAFLGEDGEKALEKLRTCVDSAEELVADEFWPMAKYQELLTSL
jgi:glutamine synthetase type III